MKPTVLIASFLLLCAACKTSDTASSKEEMLRGKWRISASKKTFFYDATQRDTTIDFFRDMPRCHKDDILNLKEVFSGEVDYGAEVCSAAEQQRNDIRWQVTNNDTVLEVNYAPQFFFGADPMRGVFVGEVTSGSMTIRYKVDSMDTQGRTYPLRYENTYTKQ